MLTRIEALNFRCLRYVSQSLDPFHVLVGPNASGKTTFFDVVGFVSRLLNEGLEAAIEAVTPNPLDLLFAKTGDRFELALEAAIPEDVQKKLREHSSNWSSAKAATQTVTSPPQQPAPSRIRYELIVSIPNDNSRPIIESERVFFVGETPVEASEIALFPLTPSVPTGLKRSTGSKEILFKNPSSEKVTFYPEVWEEMKLGSSGGFIPGFSLSNQRSALSNIPEDETLFPATVWFKRFLSAGVQQLSLGSDKLRYPSPPHRGDRFKKDGSNLPWVIAKIEGTPALTEWIEHLQTAIPDISGIRTVVREEDRYRYLKIKYRNGLEVPSWMVSDGTLRMLALTLPAFLKDYRGMLLIEEPENGLHPKALETVFQALSYIPDNQVLMSTHSPQLLVLAELPQILCFAKDSSGAVDIVSGDQHPSLVDWQRDISLGTLFAAGALE